MAVYSTTALSMKSLFRVNLTGGPAASEYICRRVSAFWNCPVVVMGNVGAALGAAVSAAKASDASVDTEQLASALCGNTAPIEPTARECTQAADFMQKCSAIIKLFLRIIHSTNNKCDNISEIIIKLRH